MPTIPSLVPALFRPPLLPVRLVRHRSAMGRKHPRTVSDLARWGYRLRARCSACGHVESLDPVPIAKACHARGWARDLDSVAQRMRCKACGKRGAECGPG